MLDTFFFVLLNLTIFVFLYLYRNQNILFIKFYFLCFYIYFLPGYIDYINNQIFVSEYYITYVCMCNIFLMIGFVLFPLRKINKFNFTNFTPPKKNKRYNYFFFIILLTTLYLKFSEVGWSIEGLFQAYLKAETENETKISTFQNFFSILLIICALYFWTETRNKFIISKINISLIVFIGLFLLLRGNRNPLMLLFLPILIYFLVSRNLFKFRILFILGFLGYFIADYIDGFRANGLLKILESGDIVKRSYSLKSVGEFGVQNRVWEWVIGPNWDFNNFYFGSTYFIHPILNVLTSIGVNFTTISGQYSNSLSSPDKVVGIGFSPYVESFINFGYLGPLFFIFFGMLLAYLNNKHIANIQKDSILKYRLFFIFPLILNFHRIDFSILIKFYFIYFLSTEILKILLTKFNFIK